MSLSQETTSNANEARKPLCTAQAPRTVLIKITGVDFGLERTEHSAERHEQAQSRATVENVSHKLPLNVTPNGQDNSGYAALRDEDGVELWELVVQLLAAGYVYYRPHAILQTKRRNGRLQTRLVNVLQFTLDQHQPGEDLPEMTPAIRDALDNGVFTNVWAYANLKTGTCAKPDTINASLTNSDYDETVRLVIRDNSYELV